MFASRLRSNFGKKQLFSVPPTQTHEIISEKKNPFCNFSFFHCPHLLLCDGRSVIMRSGFFTRKTSVSSLYFLMYFPPLSLKRPMVFIESGRGAWKKKKKSKSVLVRSLLGRWWSAAFAYSKDTYPNTERRPIFSSAKKQRTGERRPQPIT